MIRNEGAIMKRRTYDAVVVGAGATGGVAAMALCRAGMSVLLIDAGRLPGLHEAPVSADGRQPIQSQCSACTDATRTFFVDDRDNPYAMPPDRPYFWIRGRQVGGRTLTWGRGCYRMSPFELQASSIDGIGRDWPVSYDELAPFYASIERLLGVGGERDGLPQLPDGAFTRVTLSARAQHVRGVLRKAFRDRTVIAARQALPVTISRRTASAAAAACARFPRSTAIGSTIFAAMTTRRLEIAANTIASRVIMNRRSGLATGVELIEQATGRHREVSARIVVLCASAIESVRLMLNSAVSRADRGIANTSGVLGRFLMDHTATSLVGDVAFDGPRRNEVPGLFSTLHVPRFRNLKSRKRAFARAYAMSIFVDQAPDRRRSRLTFLSLGEVLPNANNRVVLHPSLRDRWGMPAALINCKYSDNEFSLALDAAEQCREMLDALGGRPVAESLSLRPGLSSHEIGGARMGDDPTSSVLNRFNQCWDVKNLFVTDGAAFPSAGVQNPTLTMMAMTARACSYIVAQSKRLEL